MLVIPLAIEIYYARTKVHFNNSYLTRAGYALNRKWRIYIMRGSKPTVLLILDGYGLNDNPEGNAIAMG